ncbi:MAG TPA: ThuA domain-containing protein [Acidimicrobiia bacterium]|nr:ThuA domain-containing protein [Acidimicrobiia bacterium]
MERFRLGSTLILASATVISCSAPVTDRPSTTPARDDTVVTEMDTTTTSHPAPDTRSDVLVFHRTEGFRHASIEAGIAAVERLGASGGYEVTATEDPGIFTNTGLESFAVIVFLNTTGDVLDMGQQSAMEAFIRSGRGFVGVHSAADTEYDWPWYGGLVGAYFERHPAPQSAIVDVVASHPVVEEVDRQFERFDEWYDFRARPGQGVTILATVDESTYEGGTMGMEHPIVWAQEYDGGRSAYIGFGHTSESFEEPLVLTLLGNAIEWAGPEPS